MMTATPALLSAPSSVVPSVVISVLPTHAEQIRRVGDADDLRRVAGQHDVLAVVVLVDDRLDVLAGRFRRSIDVGDPGDGRLAGHASRESWP